MSTRMVEPFTTRAAGRCDSTTRLGGHCTRTPVWRVRWIQSHGRPDVAVLVCDAHLKMMNEGRWIPWHGDS